MEKKDRREAAAGPLMRRNRRAAVFPESNGPYCVFPRQSLEITFGWTKPANKLENRRLVLLAALTAERRVSPPAVQVFPRFLTQYILQFRHNLQL